MSRKKKIIIAICISIMLILGLLIVIFINKKSAYDIIHKKIDNKENFLVYLYNDDLDKCLRCSNVNDIVDFYKEAYQLEFIYFNTNDTEHLKKLNEEFNFPANYLTNPAVMIFRNGELKGVVNEIVYETDLKEFLVNNNFLEEKYMKIEKGLTDEDFNSIYEGNEESLMFVSSGNILDRKKVYNIAKDNHLNYYIIYSGITSYMNGYNKLLDSTNHNLTSPSLLIVKKGEVVDYVNFKTVNDIEEFLQKNKVIN